MPETQHDSADTLGFEEIADRLSPDDPQISPDGRHVAFTVAAGGRKGDHPDRAIWLSRDRQPATRFTGGEANNHDPRWSPDGTQLLFIANRKDAEKEMLYLLPVAGGEAQRLGDLDGSLSVPSWSPDGSKIAVLRTDPETEEEKKRKTEDKEDAYLYEEDAKRSRLWVVDAATGDARQLTFGDQSVWDYAWSPDGDRIVVVTTGLHVINEFILKGSLWQVPVAGGLMTHIADFPGGPGSPVVREVDGKLVVAVIANRRREDPAESLWIVPLDGSAQTNLTPDYAGSFSQLIADPTDRAGLFARVIEGTRQRLYRISAAGGDLQPVTPANLEDRGTISTGPTVAADGRALAFIWQASDTPPEVYIADIGQDAVAVSELGKSFAGRLYDGEIVHWESTDGVTIEGILIKPDGYKEGERVPLIVEIHGGPSWQWQDRLMMSWHDWAQMLAARGYAILLPNPRGSTGYGAAFEKLLQNDIGGGEAQDVISGAKAMVERGIADPERLGIGGWSWGGYLTAWSITQTDIFKAAVMGAGVANLISDHAAGDIPAANLSYYSDDPYTDWELYARASPIRFARNVTTPTLIVHGDADIRVHPTQGQEYYRALKTIGVPTRFVRYPREGHSFQERAHQIDLMRQIVEWFERYIPV
ncbi:MAG TPA: S9 family peptidase [Thermomicrobiales bacterium]|nr:S9 family peptidase [Thermomicrobiales bacterium]